jgi:hypothetical protein
LAITLHHISFTKAQLAAVPEAERNLFVLLGHAANELAIMAKLFHFAAGNHSDNPVIEKAENAQALLLGRLLTGKIHEFWELVRTGYFGTAISRTYRNDLPPETQVALEAMGRYFGQDNLIARVRNSHAFHYDVRQIAEGFRTLGDDEPLVAYLSQMNPNSLYAFADTISGRAMLENVSPGDPALAFNALITETSRAIGWINEIAGGLMVAFLTRHLGGNMYALGAREVQIEGAPNSQDVSIPYFVEIEPTPAA